MKLMIKESNEIDMNDLKTKLENTFYRYFPNCSVEINPFKDDDGRDVMTIKAFKACKSYNQRTANEEDLRMYMDLFISKATLCFYMSSNGCGIIKPGTMKYQNIPLRLFSGDEDYVLKRFDNLCRTFKKTYKELYNA